MSPYASRRFVWWVETVASTARPSEPPTFVVVLSRLQASPASLGIVPAIASLVSEGKGEARADAEQDHHQEQIPQIVTVSRRARQQREPEGDQRQSGEPYFPHAEAHNQPGREAER